MFIFRIEKIKVVEGHYKYGKEDSSNIVQGMIVMIPDVINVIINLQGLENYES